MIVTTMGYGITIMGYGIMSYMNDNNEIGIDF